MFTQFKGQGIIIEILLFAMSIFLAIMTFMVLAGTDTTFDSSAEASIQRQADLISEKSALKLMLEGELWRANGIDESKYGDLSASKLTSHYYSTDDAIDINGNTYDRDTVKSDLETYYDYKLYQYFGGGRFGAQAQDYSLNITKDRDNIEIENLQDRAGGWTRIDRPIHLSDGETAELTFWIKNSNDY